MKRILCSLALAGLLAGLVAACADDPVRPPDLGPDHPLLSITGPVSVIEAGTGFTCAIGADGALSCWGANAAGQATAPTGTFTAVSAGREHACALGTDGSITCWGSNVYGEVTGSPSSATTGTHTGPYRDVTVGLGHSCALTEAGEISCWGNATSGYYDSLIPAGTFSQITAGYWHTCAISDAGALTCWGYNLHGQVTGTASYDAASYTPAGTYVAVNAGARHTCAIATNGDLTCWGWNNMGQVSVVATSTPTTHSFTDGPYAAVNGGESHTCATRVTGTTTCWGNDFAGQVSGTPTGVAGAAIHTFTDSYAGVTAGETHSCGISETGEPVCWGDPQAGHLVRAPFAQVSAGVGFACGVRPDGALECWGTERYGQAVAPAGTFVQVSAGMYHACALSTTGAVTCWGYNLFGQVDPSARSPKALATYSGPYAEVSAGWAHSCARTSDGDVDCWGDNAWGQVTGTPTTASPYVATGTHSGPYATVSAGGMHTCAIRAVDHSLDCWGDDDDSQLTLMPTTGAYTVVSAGTYHSCAVDTDQHVTCWGGNNGGQIGVPFDLEDDNPVAVHTFTGPFVSVSAGDVHTCALAPGGAVTCWGDDSYRQLDVYPGVYAQISVSNTQSCGVQPGGVVECWGEPISTTYVPNLPPALGTITPGSPDPVAMNTAFSVSAPFSDPDPDDAHTATIGWGDGTETAGVVSGGTVSGSHTYPAAGVYAVTITLRDAAGATDSGTYQFAVVYDPSAGFVTGGGWIDSPLGAYVADPTLTGQATFGFVSRYKKGASVPDGNTRFEFSAGTLEFHSTSYDWLVVAGASGKFKGTGTINGAGEYGFMLTATDGAISGGVDGFRIKIWEKTNEAVIYDNQPGEGDVSNATTALGGGNISIHAK